MDDWQMDRWIDSTLLSNAVYQKKHLGLLNHFIDMLFILKAFLLMNFIIYIFLNDSFCFNPFLTHYNSTFSPSAAYSPNGSNYWSTSWGCFFSPCSPYYRAPCCTLHSTWLSVSSSLRARFRCGCCHSSSPLSVLSLKCHYQPKWHWNKRSLCNSWLQFEGV